MATDKTPLLAVLIDADNTSSKHAKAIFDENILPAEPGDAKSEDRPADKRPLTEARDLIFRAMEGMEAEDDWYSLGKIGQYITAANPDFDTRTYGKRKLSDLVQSLKMLAVKRGVGNQLLLRRLD